MNWKTGATCMLGLALVAGGCGRRRQETDGEPPLAVVGGVPITGEDFTFEVQRRVQAGRPLGDPESILQELIERQAMLQAARQSEALADPVVQRELENQILVQWLDRELHRRKDAVTVSDDELRAHYEANLATFTQPALVRLAILYRRLTPGDPDETRETLTRELETARARFMNDPAAATRAGRLQGFGIIAAEHSEHTVTRYRGGDLGWLDPARADERLPAAVLQTALTLDEGAVSDLIEGPDGFYVVMRTDARDATVTPIDAAAVTLRRRVIRDKQEAMEAHFMQTLLDQADVSIDTRRAAALTLPAVADGDAGDHAMRPPVSPGPGGRLP